MRMVAVHPGTELYGSDRVFLQTLTALRGDVVAVLPSEGPLSEALGRRGIPYEVLEFPVLRRGDARTPLAACRLLARMLLAVPRLTRWLRNRDEKVLYVSTAILPVWILAGRLAGLLVHCHVHENVTTMPKLASRLLLGPLRMSHGIIANSRATQRWIIESTTPGLSSKTSVVHNGVEAPQPLSRLVEWKPNGHRRLVLVGRLSPIKGQDIAIRATAILRENGYDASLTLIGDCFSGYEWVVEELTRLVSSLGLDGHVSFEGYQSDPASYMKFADVVVVPSRLESFGLVAAEALSLGRPTVASRVGGLAEVIIDGVTGRLVPPEDPHALAAAVAAFLDDPEKAGELGRQGQVDVARRFSFDAYARAIEAALAP